MFLLMFLLMFFVDVVCVFWLMCCCLLGSLSDSMCLSCFFVLLNDNDTCFSEDELFVCFPITRCRTNPSFSLPWTKNIKQQNN